MDRLRAPLQGYLVGLLGAADDADELAQETFLVAWQRLRSLRDPGRVVAWIYGIARNLAAKQSNKPQPIALLCDPPAATDESREDRLVKSVMVAVSRLSEEHREVVLRKHFGGLTGEQIARQLGIAPGTVRSRLSRAYGQLREMLKQEEDE